MLSFDKATYLSLLFKFLSLFYLKYLVILCEIRCFTVLGIHKYGIHSVS